MAEERQPVRYTFGIPGIQVENENMAADVEADQEINPEHAIQARNDSDLLTAKRARNEVDDQTTVRARVRLSLVEQQMVPLLFPGIGALADAPLWAQQMAAGVNRLAIDVNRLAIDVNRNSEMMRGIEYIMLTEKNNRRGDGSLQPYVEIPRYINGIRVVPSTRRLIREELPNLIPLNTLAAVNALTRQQLDLYFEFYGIVAPDLLQDKKQVLLNHIGSSVTL
ncbi:hypothetical protein MIR68_010484 [Amoeboaphelidium protococcarum]|nr:hypothetical protein MIR68_010484 [Amoeboaphelidium protococcarum]